MFFLCFARFYWSSQRTKSVDWISQQNDSVRRLSVLVKSLGHSSRLEPLSFCVMQFQIPTLAKSCRLNKANYSKILLSFSVPTINGVHWLQNANISSAVVQHKSVDISTGTLRSYTPLESWQHERLTLRPWSTLSSAVIYRSAKIAVF